MRSLLFALLLLPRIAVADVTAPVDLLAPAPPLDPLSVCFALETRPFVEAEARALQQRIDALPLGPEKEKLLAEQVWMMSEVALGDARHLPPAIEKARAFAVQFPKSQHADRALFDLALLQMRAQQPVEARETLKWLIRTYPRSLFYSDVLVIFGNYYFDQGEWEEALEFYEKVDALVPRGRCAAFARYREGLIDLERHDPKGALEVEYSLLTDGNQRGQLAAAIRRALVEAYAEIGEAKKARPFFKRAADEAEVAAMLRELALRYRRRNDEASAIAVERDPSR